MTTDTDDWYVDASDDEKYDPSKSGAGIWRPNPEDILQMFETLSKQKVIELTWKCPGRRPPDTEKPPEEEELKDIPMETEEAPLQEEPKAMKPTEFDFDDDEFGEGLPVTPKRTPGSKTPKSQKKVAKMDKILQDVMLKQKKDSAEREAKRRLQRSPRTPQMGPRMRLTAPGLPPMPAGFPPGITTHTKSVSSDDNATSIKTSIVGNTQVTDITSVASVTKQQATPEPTLNTDSAIVSEDKT